MQTSSSGQHAHVCVSPAFCARLCVCMKSGTSSLRFFRIFKAGIYRYSVVYRYSGIDLLYRYIFKTAVYWV
jgi:hypothetical protein